MPGSHHACTAADCGAASGEGIISDLQWNPYPQDWRQLGGQPPYQGDPYRAPEDKPSGPEPADGGGRPPKRGNRHVVRNILGCIGILAVIGLVASALSSSGTGASTGGNTRLDPRGLPG